MKIHSFLNAVHTLTLDVKPKQRVWADGIDKG